MATVGDAASNGAGEGGGGNPNPTAMMVTFPRRNQVFAHEPLKLEADDEASESANPRNMWQVYALGGFMVMRWIWAKWKERNDRRGPEDS